MRREQVPLITWLGERIRALRIPFELSEKCIWYQALEDEPWDMIAWKHWKREDLWYLIADVNGIDDPFEFPEGGERIAIPKVR